MALDPSIALGVKPLEVANPLAQYGQVAQLQHYQQQNALAQRAMGQEDALNQAYAASIDATTGQIDPNKLRQNMATGGIASKLPAAEKSIMEGRELKAKVGKGELELGIAQADNSMRQIAGYNTRADALTHIRSDISAGKITQQQGQQFASMLPPDDAGMPQFQLQMMRKALSAKDQLEQHFASQDMGAGGRVVSTPKYGGGSAQVVPGSQFTKSVSPDAAARLAAESATGVLTPQSLDVAANVYLQTGTLPTGLGKAAAGLRSQVMNRATELSTGKPAADVAGDIVGAKLDVASRGKAIKDFSTGIQGRQVNAFNTAIDHLGTMDKLSDALANGDLKAINAVGNVIARQTGQPAPTNFDAAKQIVTAEVIKAVVASGGGVTERQEAERNFSAANSPEMLKGVINTYKQLLGGQLKSLGLQYENTTGRKDFDNKLTGDAKAELQKLRGGEAKPAPASAATPIYATNGTQRIMSTDGGVNWVPAK
jgi:hypothetical protein